MLHGGARPGAGRPKGATGKKTKEIISAIEAAGIMPRDVMLHVMREHFNKGEYDAAVEVAAKVAPYVHPRLAASSGTLKRPSEMTDEAPGGAHQFLLDELNRIAERSVETSEK